LSKPVIDCSALSDSEISRLVAERVMGEAKPLGSPDGAAFSKQRCWHWIEEMTSGQEVSGSWHPVLFAANIGCAWRVVERMRTLGRTCLIMMSGESGLAIATFYRGPRDRSDLSATDWYDKAPRAICIAALKAREEDNG
jgi:Phage ABA sandwich domain